MMPLPYRALTSLFVRYNGSGILIDCGEGTQITTKRLGWSFKSIDLIMITHFHADHISGLPGFLLMMGNAGREEKLTIAGPPGIEKVCRSLLIIAPHLPFPIEYLEIDGPEKVIEMLGLTITSFKVNHNLTCYGYSIELARQGKFDAEAARAKGIPLQCWNRLQHGETVEMDGVTYTSDMVMGAPRKGLKVTYSTDSRPTPSITEHAKGSDLFICEGMYGEPGNEEKAVEKKHMTMYEAAEIAKEADVKEMWLTHYSPSMNKPQEFEEAVKAIFPRTVIAKDRQTLELRFEEE
jgi:ribonuclease Z